MEEVYDIGEVAAATGLTLRALRFYEARGLVTPLRTAGGRRVYGRGELHRLTAAVALKRAGFSLQKIGELLNNWKSSPDVGFSKAVWDFIMTATRARLEAGGTVDGPAWMTGAR